MTNLLKLRGKVVENGFTLEKLAESIGMDYSTLYRKMKNNGLSFTIEEANKIVEVLKLTREEALSIFFAGCVA